MAVNGSWPIKDQWYNVIWVTVLLIVITICMFYIPIYLTFIKPRISPGGDSAWGKLLQGAENETLEIVAPEAEVGVKVAIILAKFFYFFSLVVTFLVIPLLWYLYVYWAYLSADT